MLKRTLTHWMLVATFVLGAVMVGIPSVMAFDPTGTMALFDAVDNDHAVAWVNGSEPGSYPFFDVKLMLTNVTDAYAASFSLEYDPAILNYSSHVWGDAFAYTGKVVLPLPPTIDYTNGYIIGGSIGQLGPTSQSVKNYTDPAWGWIATFTFEFIGTPPTVGFPIHTLINITNLLTRTSEWWKLVGSFPEQGPFQTYTSCGFHYETAFNTVHLESEEDTGTSANLGTIAFDGVSYNLPEDLSKMVGTYQTQYFADAGYLFVNWETTGLISVSDVNSNPATLTVSGDGNLKAIYASHHTDHFNDDYVPMVIPVNENNLTISPVITCTILENGVFKPFHYPCKSAQTDLTDGDWSDGDANYTYVFEDWVDYDWNDIVVSFYAVTSDVITIEVRLIDREAVWKNPLGCGITLDGMDAWVHWNSTDYPEEHMVRVNSSEIEDIELFSESNPGDNASITIIPIIPPTYTLTITSTSGGTTDPLPNSYPYPEGTVVSVTAIPDSGYILDHWELDGVDVGSTHLIDVTIDADHTLHAVFKHTVYYTLTITSTSGGTTYPSPGTYSYAQGTVVRIEADPETGYVFDCWFVDVSHAVVNNPIFIEMDANHNLHAVFKEPLPPPPVGGHVTPIGQPHLPVSKVDLTPGFGLASVFLAAVAVVAILIKSRKRH